MHVQISDDERTRSGQGRTTVPAVHTLPFRFLTRKGHGPSRGRPPAPSLWTATCARHAHPPHALPRSLMPSRLKNCPPHVASSLALVHVHVQAKSDIQDPTPKGGGRARNGTSREWLRHTTGHFKWIPCAWCSRSCCCCCGGCTGGIQWLAPRVFYSSQNVPAWTCLCQSSCPKAMPE